MIKFSIRRLLNRHGHAVERGMIADIADKTRIHINTAMKYFNGIELQAVHLDVLTKICDYLRERGIEAELPASLFYNDTLWDGLKDLQITFFVGANRFEGEDPAYEGRVARHDHQAQTLLATRLAQLRPAVGAETNEEFVEYDHISERGSDPPSKESEDKATALYARYFSSNRKLKGTISVASQKSNLVSELFVADTFREEPFKKSDDPKVPFFLVAREDDLPFRSCFGGKEPPAAIARAHAPGIHFRMDGSWGHSIEWYEDTQDAGAILIRHRPVADVIDVAIFGFSAKGTCIVAKHFIEGHEEITKFWDEPIDPKAQHPRIGLFLCEIALADETVRQTIPIDCSDIAAQDQPPDDRRRRHRRPEPRDGHGGIRRRSIRTRNKDTRSY